MPKWSGEVEEFRAWARDLILDSGEPWELEDFQLEVIQDYLWRGVDGGRFEEIWLVVPEGNGKTTLLAGIALHHLVHTPSASVAIGASTREQAELLFRQAAGFIARTPKLGKQLRAFRGYRKIYSKTDESAVLEVKAADAGTGDGIIPTLAMLDELHRHKNLDLYTTWRGKLDKRDGQLMTISTAGNPSSVFEDMRSKFRRQAKDLTERGPYIRAAGNHEVIHDWAVREVADADDLGVVAAANPRLAVTSETLRKRFESPTMTKEHWYRFVCNIATRTEGQAIMPFEWDKLAEPDMKPDPAAWTVGFLDLAWKRDTTAMGVLVWESHERRLLTGIRVISPPVQEASVVEGLLELRRRFPLMEGIVYDPSAGGQQMAQMLEDGSHPLQEGGEPFTFFEHSQDNAPICLASQRFDEAVRLGWIRHDGDSDLRAHILNAYRREMPGEKWRYDRPPDAKGDARSRFPIDALTGAIMGHSVAVAEHEFEGDPLFAFAAR